MPWEPLESQRENQTLLPCEPPQGGEGSEPSPAVSSCVIWGTFSRGPLCSPEKWDGDRA